jgi:DAACS family dicarboxylate/amino acid:cation (Na+ or H+) symporter
MAPQKKMLIGIAAGAALGLVASAIAPGAPWLMWTVDHISKPVGKVFLNLIFMLVIPVLFSALVTGVGELDLRHIGRIGARTLGYTVVVSAIAVLIGLVLVNVLQPGSGLPDELREMARRGASIKAATAPSDTSFVGFLVAMVPDNAVSAAANGNYLGLMTFSLAFGIGLALTQTDGSARLREVIQGVYDVAMRLIDGVLWLAPIGVAALLFTATSQLGFPIVRQLAAYVGVVLLGLGLHMFVVYSISVRLFGGMSPVRFFRDVRAVIATAFSTASSNATLPTALRVAEENLRLPPHVSRFVLTAGSTMNQNGTALFEGVTVIFLAQLYGVELSLARQALVMWLCILGGIGTAGVPSGSLPVIAMILGMTGIPPEGLGLILGVNHFLDMCRTTLNVTGDLAAAVYVARGEPPTAVGHQDLPG